MTVTSGLHRQGFTDRVDDVYRVDVSFLVLLVSVKKKFWFVAGKRVIG